MEREILEETGLKVEAKKVVFAKTYPEKRDMVAIYFLCRPVDGNPSPSNEISEMEWVHPNEVEKYFTTSFRQKLREFLLSLGE